VSLSLLFLPAVAAAGLAFALTPLASRLAWRVGAIDLPDVRKIHDTPTPRLGGVAVVAALLVTLAVVWVFREPAYPQLSRSLFLALTLGLLPVFLVSCRDDVRGVGPAVKLAGQLAGAAIAVLAGLHLNETIHLFGQPIPLGSLAIPLSLLWIVGVTNAFNLVDGLDGLSAGLGLISAATLAIVAGLTGDGETLVLSLILLGALAGFIPYNVHPARTFLGDSGANAIGFCLACLTLSGGSRLSAGLAVLVPLLAIGVPVADTLVSIVRRLLRGVERRTGFAVLRADREHIHHRLLRLGLNHGRAVLILYSAGVAAAAVGIASLFVTASNAWLLLAALVGACLVGVGRLGYDEFAVLRRGVVLKLYDRVGHTGHFKVFIDIGLAMLAFYGAVALKYDAWDLTAHRVLLVDGFALLPAVNLVVFWSYRVYDRAWRLASVDDVITVNCAVATSAAAGFVLTRLLFDSAASASLFAIHGVLLMLLTSAARASFRILAHVRDRSRPEGRRVAIYGAGVRGIMALREIRRNPRLNLQPVGFLDDDPSLYGHRVSGLKVLGNVTGLEQLIDEKRLEGVLLACDQIAPSRLGVAMHACHSSGIGIYRFNVGVQTLASRRELTPAAELRPAPARPAVRPA
jgi:UDP-GlcNAc:undecaprenyl-phosphate GlcNAc-1-phosphate transferase